MNDLRIVIFAKAPLPGTVKTRLIPALGADGAAALAREMLQRTLHAALHARLGAVELCVSPSPEDPVWRECPMPDALALSAQGEGDLGLRMARAARRGLTHNQAVLLIGTDCAEMCATLLGDAAHSLLTHDAVMYPAADGGYALLGLRRFAPALFENIPWSTPQVGVLTRQRIEALGWTLHIGPLVHDIDEAADLVHWKSCSDTGDI